MARTECGKDEPDPRPFFAIETRLTRCNGFRDLLVQIGSGVLPFGTANVLSRPCVHRGMAGTCARGLRLFHDAAAPEITLGQTTPRGGLRLGVDGFDGSFVSLALALPPGITRTLTRFHLLELRLSGHFDGVNDVFARLNMQCGPNLENQIEGPLQLGGRAGVQFDLAHFPVDETRRDNAWVDLIFDSPQGLSVEMTDLVLARMPRGAF